MLHLTATSPPKSGRSRFSKALPAVPDLNKSAVLPPPPPHLPSLPLPSQAAASPQSNSPLQPVLFSPSSLSSSSSSSALPSSGQSKAMSIPRKPVRKPLEPSSSSTTVITSTPTTAPPEPHSPTDSIASILSAYSRSSGESLVRLSDGSASMRDSNATVSPTSDAPSLPSTIVKKPLQRKAVGGGLPPSPPTKDDRFQPLISSSSIPPASSGAVATPSSSQPQLWRRRSRSSSRGLADLNLPLSHGSTAATQSSSQAPEQTTSPETLKTLPRTPQPPAAPKGLPGRNIRPTAPSDTKLSDTTASNNAVKPSEKALPHVNSNAAVSSASPDISTQPSVKRPPTPEYQKEDVKSPIIDTYVSPVSPASSPEPSNGFADIPKPSPQTPQWPQTQQHPAPMMNSGDKTALEKPKPMFSPDLHSARSVPNLRNKPPSPANEPIPREASGGDAMTRGRVMNDMPSDRFRHSGDSMASRARSSSARPGQRRPMEQMAPVPPESDPRLVYSETQGYLYKGRDGTLYPEMKELREPDARAFRFPAQSQDKPSIDTIYRAAPLRSSHYNCYQNHRSMNRKSNKSCPLTCQTCDKSDSEDRWCCTFCHVRMCEACFRIFNDNQRDLQRLKTALGSGGSDLFSSQGFDASLGLMIS